MAHWVVFLLWCQGSDLEAMIKLYLYTLAFQDDV